MLKMTLAESDGDDIKELVREAYDSIAPHFSRTRERIWPPTEVFLKEVSPCKIADLGCGTGRAISRCVELGCDIIGIDGSSEQLGQSRERLENEGAPEGSYTLIQADLEDLPLEDMSVHNCIMIASLHHLPTGDQRINSLKEALRITRPGGYIQVSAWTWDQKRFGKDHLSRINGERETGPQDGALPGDFLVPWKEGVRRLRFYHLYGPGELEEEVKEAGWKLTRSYFDGRNHWAEASKSMELHE